MWPKDERANFLLPNLSLEGVLIWVWRKIAISLRSLQNFCYFGISFEGVFHELDAKTDQNQRGMCDISFNHKFIICIFIILKCLNRYKLFINIWLSNFDWFTNILSIFGVLTCNKKYFLTNIPSQLLDT
jgi:hypothetical protein